LNNMDSEKRGCAAIAYAKGKSHKFYEDRFRLLTSEAPLVHKHSRGQLFAVFDGVSSAPKGMSAAQFMSDSLTTFFSKPDQYPATADGLLHLLHDGNMKIHGWGYDEETRRIDGACVGTVIWIIKEDAYVLHCGDTTAFTMVDNEMMKITSVDKDEAGKIINYFGAGEKLKLTLRREDLTTIERVLVVSDGVTDFCSAVELAPIIRKSSDAQKAAIEIVRLAEAKGSHDDITALVIDVDEIDDEK